MYVVIVDYGSGNLKSVFRAVDLAAKDRSKLKIKVSSSPLDISEADKIILPGQGSYKNCIDTILSKNGLMESLNNFVLNKKKPILGICVGMQLFSKEGFEAEKTKGFGWINAYVTKIPLNIKNLKLPHVGWNKIKIIKKKKLLRDLRDNCHFYFVHSYEFVTTEDEIVLAKVDYGKEIIVCIEKENIFGCQFHPEKSQVDGIKLISNFLKSD